jgi:hypothetical protein
MDKGKMRNRLVVVAGFGLMVLLAAPALGVDVTVVDLVADGAAYADAEITVSGELIGDYGNRRDGSTWTQLNGDSYGDEPIADGGALTGSNVGIGIRMPTELAEGLDPPGRYRTVGPLVRVTGIWKYHDPARQGETYLDVAVLEAVRPGRILSEPPLWGAFAGGVVLLVIAGLAWWRYTRKRDAVE